MGAQFDALPYQDAPEPPLTPALRAACHDAVHLLLPDGRVLRAGRAVLYVLGLLGHPQLAAVGRLPPLIWAIELGYLLVARNRAFFARFLFTQE